jgi:hypothetical protein
MAAHNISRRTRRRGRTVGNRPESHLASSRHPRSSTALHMALKEVRSRLDVAGAVASIVSAALKAQRAGADIDAANALQRCVCDVLFELGKRLERIASKLERASGGVQ